MQRTLRSRKQHTSMAIHSGVGFSKEPDARLAGEAAAKEALKEAGVDACDLVLVAITIGHDQQAVLDGIRSVTKDARLVGCSTHGIISKEGPDESLKRVEVMVISSESTRFTVAKAGGLKADPEKAGATIAEQMNAAWPEKPQALLVLADGITINPDALFRGLEKTLKAPLPFIGGTAGELFEFKQTYQYFDGEVMSDGVVCVLLSGDVGIEVGVSHGSKPIGIVRTVTKAEGNHLYEIDGKPAFEIFQEFLGPEVKDLSGTTITGVCLGVEVPEEMKGKYEDVILRIPVGMDPKDHSLYMAAEWPVGTKVFVCRRDPESMIRRTREIADKVKSMIGKPPALLLHFNCAGRSKKFIGAETARRVVEETQSWGASVPCFAFYTYGEIAPVAGKNQFHNWSSVLCAIYEK